MNRTDHNDMTSPPRQHDSFVLRIWREQAGAGAEEPFAWRGWVQHVYSGEAAYVQDVAALLAFIERRAGRLGAAQLRSPRLK